MDRLEDRARNIALYVDTNRRMDELQKYIVALSNKAESNFAALMNQI